MKTSFSAKITMTIIGIYLVFPVLATFVYSMFAKWDGILPEGFVVSHYSELFRDTAFLLSLGRTIILCIIPIAITVLAVLLALFAVTLFFPRLEKYMQLLCMIPYTLQGVILSVSILSLYAGVDSFLSNRVVMLIGAYCVIILPYVYQGIRNSMRAVNMPRLIEAAEICGASKLYAFFRVIVPNILTGIVVSCLLAQGIIFGDYVLIRNLTGSAFQNVQVFFFQTMKVSSQKSSAIFVIIMLVTFCIAALVLYVQNRENKRRLR